MTETDQRISGSTQDLSHEDLQDLLAHHQNQNYRQAQRERSAQLMWFAIWCRKILQDVVLAASHWIAVLAARGGLPSRGR
jgi:hypothetical protein